MFPYDWIWTLLFVAFLLLGGLLFYGFARRGLNKNEVLRGYIPFFTALGLSVLIGILLWKIFSVGISSIFGDVTWIYL